MLLRMSAHTCSRLVQVCHKTICFNILTQYGSSILVLKIYKGSAVVIHLNRIKGYESSNIYISLIITANLVDFKMVGQAHCVTRQLLALSCHGVLAVTRTLFVIIVSFGARVTALEFCRV